jgi:hypothetical protein
MNSAPFGRSGICTAVRLNGGALNGIALPLARDKTTRYTIRYVPYYIVALEVVVNGSQAGYEWLRRLPGRLPTIDASAVLSEYGTVRTIAPLGDCPTIARAMA